MPGEERRRGRGSGAENGGSVNWAFIPPMLFISPMLLTFVTAPRNSNTESPHHDSARARLTSVRVTSGRDHTSFRTEKTACAPDAKWVPCARYVAISALEAQPAAPRSATINVIVLSMVRLISLSLVFGPTVRTHC